MLLRLLGAIDRSRFEPHVISLTDLGEIADGLRALDIPVFAAGMTRGSRLPPVGAFTRLVRELRRLRPDLVQTWMYHANLVGGLASLAAGRPPLIWSIRQTNLDAESVRRRTALVARLGAKLSHRLPHCLLYNSKVSRRVHEAIGYRADRARVIPNGFDVEKFQSAPKDRAALRRELGLAEDRIVIGLIARFDPQKDHRSFLEAAALVRRQSPTVELLLAGLDVDQRNAGLTAEIARLGLTDSVHLLGHRRDVPRLLGALDIACSSSMGEGFPNAVGEAMAAGLPCVVTDVGDSAFLLGNCGHVVPPREPAALAEALLSVVRSSPAERRRLGQAARARIERKFSLAAVAGQHMDIWSDVIDDRQPRRSSEQP